MLRAEQPLLLRMPSMRVLTTATTINIDRSSERVARDPKEIGIQALRGGTIVGEHDIMFAGRDEVITFTHTAYSREIFAKGAVEAAKFLAGKPARTFTIWQM